jgi:hypothetical protein
MLEIDKIRSKPGMIGPFENIQRWGRNALDSQVQPILNPEPRTLNHQQYF